MKFHGTRILLLLFMISGVSYAADKPPVFSDFPVKEQYTGKPTQVDFNSHPKAKKYRTALRDGAKSGPNFAGHFTYIEWGCGTACVEFAFVDAKNGRVYFPTTIKLNSYALVHDDTDPIEYQKNSTLFIVSGEPNDAEKLGMYYYTWTGSDLKLVHKIDRTFEPK